jgi:hypothetical protein
MGPFPLKHVDLDLGLRVGSRGESLGLLGRDSGVARNHGRSHATQRLDGQGERGYVEQQQILDLAGQYAGLDRRADSYHLIGVHAAMGILAEHGLHQFLNLGHACLPAHQNHFANLIDADAGVAESLLAGLERALKQIADQLFQLGAGQLANQVLGSAGVGGHKGQIDLSLDGCRELDLGLLRGILEPLQGHFIAL